MLAIAGRDRDSARLKRAATTAYKKYEDPSYSHPSQENKNVKNDDKDGVIGARRLCMKSQPCVCMLCVWYSRAQARDEITKLNFKRSFSPCRRVLYV